MIYDLAGVPSSRKMTLLIILLAESRGARIKDLSRVKAFLIYTLVVLKVITNFVINANLTETYLMEVFHKTLANHG